MRSVEIKLMFPLVNFSFAIKKNPTLLRTELQEAKGLFLL